MIMIDLAVFITQPIAWKWLMQNKVPPWNLDTFSLHHSPLKPGDCHSKLKGGIHSWRKVLLGVQHFCNEENPSAIVRPSKWSRTTTDSCFQLDQRRCCQPMPSDMVPWNYLHWPVSSAQDRWHDTISNFLKLFPYTFFIFSQNVKDTQSFYDRKVYSAKWVLWHFFVCRILISIPFA